MGRKDTSGGPLSEMCPAGFTASLMPKSTNHRESGRRPQTPGCDGNQAEHQSQGIERRLDQEKATACQSLSLQFSLAGVALTRCIKFDGFRCRMRLQIHAARRSLADTVCNIGLMNLEIIRLLPPVPDLCSQGAQASGGPKPKTRIQAKCSLEDGVTGPERPDNSHLELLDPSAQANSTLPSPSLHCPKGLRSFLPLHFFKERIGDRILNQS